MISDEMRELLSSYVDGELRDADAARVEDASKRDPELRREIEAFRTLRKKLREWDDAEHAVAPPAASPGRVLARARAMDAALRAPGTRLSGLLRPLGVAAGVLVAAGAGLYLALPAAPGAPPPRAPAGVAVAPLGPAPELALPDSALEPASELPATAARGRIHDHFMSRRATELEEAMRREEQALVRATPAETPPERRSAPSVNAEVALMVEGYAPAAEPSQALVLLERPPAVSKLPAVGEAPAARRRAIEPEEGRIYQEMLGVPHAVLAPLGEVWVGSKDRTRVVAASDWVEPGQVTGVVWADEIEAPRSNFRLEVQEFVLGPRARQRLLGAKAGRDAAFREWLARAYGGPVPAAFVRGARERERTVNRLVRALEADAGATGFAVLDAKGKLLGVELFHAHALMVALAPRLLRGYVLEAGDDGIRVEPPPPDHPGIEAVKAFLEGLPARGLRVERQRLADVDAPGLCRANVVAPSGAIIGHGLLADDAPVHLTLFGE